MSSVASAVVRESDAPLVKGRQPRKFTPENIARIKDWVTQGVGRDEIANRLEVTVGSLQVTCSKLGISLRRSALAESKGAIQPLGLVQRSIEHIQQGDHPAQVKFTLLIQKQSRQAAFDLPLHQDLIEQLALEASVRGLTIVRSDRENCEPSAGKDLVGEILRNCNLPSQEPGRARET